MAPEQRGHIGASARGKPHNPPPAQGEIRAGGGELLLGVVSGSLLLRGAQMTPRGRYGVCSSERSSGTSGSVLPWLKAPPPPPGGPDPSLGAGVMTRPPSAGHRETGKLVPANCLLLGPAGRGSPGLVNTAWWGWIFGVGQLGLMGRQSNEGGWAPHRCQLGPPKETGAPRPPSR